MSMDGFICANCKQKVTRYNLENYAFKRTTPQGVKKFCCYTCMRNFDRQYPRKVGKLKNQNKYGEVINAEIR